MTDFNVILHYNEEGKKMEEVIIDYFSIYLDIKNEMNE